MNRIKLFLSTLLVIFVFAACDTAPTVPNELTLQTVGAASGFDEYGYNDVAGIFNGAADGVDRILDGKVWGDPTYANDHLVMKWNKAWENCNANRSPENCAGAWTNNEWNGKLEGGSGESWIYKFVWDNSCRVNNTPTAEGGYCIWNEYAVVMSQGSIANQHFWDAHAKPNGFGAAGG